MSTALALVLLAVSVAGAYPWINYFEKPEMQYIHFAFPDSAGNVIVASGDFHNFRPQPPGQVYRFKGMYSITGAEVQELLSAPSIYVLDGVIDQEGITWLLIATWREEECSGIESEALAWNEAYREHYYPHGWWGHLKNFRLALLGDDRLVEHPELTEWIPGDIVQFSSDGGRFFAVSWETNGNPYDFEVLRQFISWWWAGNDGSQHTLPLEYVCPAACDARVMGYPEFGPDHLAYFLIRCQLDGSTKEYALLCLNAETEEWDVYDEEDSPFLDCAIEYFRIDDNNVKWFGTENGLVVFDGENWIRLTTDNSDLPYNLVRQIEYDDVDDVYYVISQMKIDNSYNTAFTILMPDGRSLGEPLRFEETFYPWEFSTIYRDPHGIWWLWPFEGYSRSSMLYSYDHVRVIYWDLTTWTHLNPDSMYRGYISPLSAERSFLATPTCVMIW